MKNTQLLVIVGFMIVAALAGGAGVYVFMNRQSAQADPQGATSVPSPAEQTAPTPTPQPKSTPTSAPTPTPSTGSSQPPRTPPPSQIPAVTGTVRIQSISPRAGSVGILVMLNGVDFTLVGNQVHFGANYAPLLNSPDGTSIKFAVPGSVTPGEYNVYVTNANGTSNTVTFTVW